MTLERHFIERDLLPHNSNVKRQFDESVGWKFFTSKLLEANDYLVKEFYANVAPIKKGTHVTKVRNKKIQFDGKTLNTYAGFDDVDVALYIQKLALDKAARPWVAEVIAIPGTTPAWLTPGVSIARNTLSFEAKGWCTFVCSRLDPCHHDSNIPLSREILIASIIAGYLINVGNLMAQNISKETGKEERSYPYPNFITLYLENQGVEGRHFDTKVKPKRPLSWYNLQGADNPKSKGKATTSTSQSAEPRVVATGSEPSTAESSLAAMPPPSSGTSVTTPLFVPLSFAYPLTSLRVSQTLSSVNIWLQEAISKLSVLSSAVAAQAAPAQLQVPPSVEDSLKELLDNQKKLLDNQKKILETLDTHGKVIKELGKQVKKMKKTQASKESVELLKKEVEKFTSTGDIPLDLLMEETAPAAQKAQASEQEADREPVRGFVVPQSEDLKIQLEVPEGVDDPMQSEVPTSEPDPM
nr:uncharacterized protein LOC104107887 [Nicotiana tomentosiformis]XP_033514991.1 uncharacterized protein LOC104107887 [Nicotiana tomentosiformis]XP_033514992.1 uncharacterized protein LOC104107887 [Nicotiana tomentosiformis]XP_033514993.1 uncharacterized protein LOC104107887 [Nicotiana tomentosiformis]